MRAIIPVPIRNKEEWDQYLAFLGNVPLNILSMLEKRAEVVCRECYGFGHSRTRCPTRNRLN